MQGCETLFIFILFVLLCSRTSAPAMKADILTFELTCFAREGKWKRGHFSKISTKTFKRQNCKPACISHPLSVTAVVIFFKANFSVVFHETKGKELSLANHYKCPRIPMNQSELEVTLLACVKPLGTLPSASHGFTTGHGFSLDLWSKLRKLYNGKKEQSIRVIPFVPQLKNVCLWFVYSSVGRSEGSLFAQPEATFVKEV